ncbi:MAG: glycosyltransferase family 4 protein [Chloroflexota bacterium]|nr:glycosyltransferase family 4 protein [Chloroflexota bacterium]
MTEQQPAYPPRREAAYADLIVVALGELSRAEAQAMIEPHFGRTSTLAWFDRDRLRRRPVTTLLELRRQRYDAAVLVAPDLRQPRLRLTSLVLGLTRARTHWRLDRRGNREAWSLGAHLAGNLWPIARHLVACGLVLGLSDIVLRAADHVLQPRVVRLKRPSRILYLRSQLWLGLEGGGSVAHTAGVVRGLEQAGVEVEVVSSDRLPGVTAPTALVSPEMWFDGWLREVEDLAYNVSFSWAAFRTAGRGRPHAIYQRHTTFNCSGALLSRLTRLPLVLEFNSSEVWKGRYWGGLRLAGTAALVERINLRAADRLVVVSQVLADYVRSQGVPAEKILVNPNAVDPAQFRPDLDATLVRQSLGLKSTLVVGFSGTFGNWHGIPALAEAVPRVCQARPNVRWLLIGDGPLRHLVDAAVRAHALADRVHQPGLVPHARMPAYLAACDVLVSPHGRQADGGEFFGSPTKLFEYMAVGRPIVASAVGQIADVLQDEQSALLVPPDDPQALSGAIIRLVDDACLRDRLGRAARRAAVERHTWRQNADRLLGWLGA